MTCLKKEKTAKLIPNAIQICTESEKVGGRPAHGGPVAPELNWLLAPPCSPGPHKGTQCLSLPFLFILPAPAPVVPRAGPLRPLLSQALQSVCPLTQLFIVFIEKVYQFRGLLQEAFPDTPFYHDCHLGVPDGCLTLVAQTGQEKEMGREDFTASLCFLLAKVCPLGYGRLGKCPGLP